MDIIEQCEVENMDRGYDHPRKGEWSKKEQPSGLNRGEIRSSADGIGKQYLDYITSKNNQSIHD
jgi:hypothetical protein